MNTPIIETKFPISTERNFEFEYVQRNGNYTSYFNDVTDINNFTLVSYECKNSQGDIRWINGKVFDANPTENIISNNKIKYLNCFPNVDVEYIVENEQLKENIILKSQVDAPQFMFSLKLDENVSMLPQPDGSIDFIDLVTLEKLWSMPAPFAIDAEGNRTNDVSYSQDEVFYNGIVYKSLSVTINDVNFLNNAVYPVTIDPTICSGAWGSYYEPSMGGGKNIVRLNSTTLFACNGRFGVYISTDNGASWGISLTPTVVGTANSGGGSLAVRSGKVLYTWPAGSPEYKLKICIYSAGAWGTQSDIIAANSYEIHNPTISVGPSGKIYIVYYEKNSGHKLAVSTDGGATWPSTAIVISTISYAYLSQGTVFETTGGYALVVYNAHDTAGSTVYYKWSTDYGATWGAEQTLDTGCTGTAICEDAYGGNVAVVFTCHNNTSLEIFKFASNGSTSPAGTALTLTTSSVTVSVYKNGGGIYIVTTGSGIAYNTEFYKYTGSAITLLSTLVTGNSRPFAGLAYQNNGEGCSGGVADIICGQLVASTTGYSYYNSYSLLWAHKLMGVSTPNKIMGMQPSKVMGIA